MVNIGYNPFTNNFDFLGNISTTSSDTSSGGTTTDLSYFVLSEKSSFSFNDSIKTLCTFFNKKVIEIRVTINEPFNGIGTSITIGNSTVNDMYIKTTDVHPKMEGTYVTEVDLLVPEDTLILYINGTNIDRGSGSLIIKYVIGG